MDWHYIEKELGISARSVGDSADEILNSLTHLESKLGRSWIENTLPRGSKTMAWAAILVDFDKCLKITDEIKRGNSLKRKLVTGFRVDKPPAAMDEARVGIRLVSRGAQLEYEPLFPSESRKPDFLATFDKEQVAIEVTRLQLSAEDTEQQKRQASLACKCGSILAGGSLDIYLTEPIIKQQIENLIAKETQDLVSVRGNTDYFERRISKTVYLVYDPTGSVRKDRANAPVPTRNERWGVLVFVIEGDRSSYIKEELGIMCPMPAVAFCRAHVRSDGYKIPTVVRVYRVASDSRVMIKAIEEATQLPSNIPGIVVIDMSRTVAHPYDWATEVRRAFRARVYPKLNAVWLRSAVVAHACLEWTECLVVNPYANMYINSMIIDRISPGGKR